MGPQAGNTKLVMSNGATVSSGRPPYSPSGNRQFCFARSRSACHLVGSELLMSIVARFQGQASRDEDCWIDQRRMVLESK